MFKLSISNIAWTEKEDNGIYSMIKSMGFSGLEIAPTRVFPINPYEHINDAKVWSDKIFDEYGLTISSIQSIWYGRTESLFGSDMEREELVQYTKKTILFAEAIGCKNIVFGCPGNRAIPEGMKDDVAVQFFKTIGDYACTHSTVVGIEANPTIYNTNYINTTKDALNLIERTDSPGFRLNLDIGTMVYNEEDISILTDAVNLINHVHISEPGLKVIRNRTIHNELRDLLKDKYDKFISIEMSKESGIAMVKQSMIYVSEIFS